MFRKKYKYTFIKKSVPGAKESLIMSAVSLGIFVAVSVSAYSLHGKGGTVLGAIGLVGMLIAMYGFYLGIRAMSNVRASHLLTALGTIFAGVMSIVWIATYFMGL